MHTNTAHMERHSYARSLQRALITYSGNAYRAAGRCKQVAAAHGLDVSRGTRYRQGDKSSPLARAFEYLASCPLTTAWTACAEGMALVTQLEIMAADTDALIRRRDELVDVEHDLERDENRATQRADTAACIKAHERKAAAHLELLALYRELERRGVK